MTTDKQLIEKLKELNLLLKTHYYPWEEEPLKAQLESEIAALESQSEESYPREFVEWLKDECEVYFDTASGHYLWVYDEKSMTTSEAFEYWQ
jgi:hypothetical protein